MKGILLSLAVSVFALSMPSSAMAKAEMQSGTIERSAGFTVLVNGPSGWVEKDMIGFGADYAHRTIDVASTLPDPEGLYKIRVRHDAAGASFLDSILLNGGTKSLKPTRAFDIETGEDLSSKLRKSDLDVIPMRGRTVEVEFDAKKAGRMDAPIQLVVTAREADPKASLGIPCLYPSRQNPWQGNENAFTYEVNRNFGAIKVDGEFTVSDRLEDPFFSILTKGAAGNPGGYAYGYIRNDNRYLYGAIDFTPDNTGYSDEDFGAILVKTADGWKEFRVSEADTRWGKPGYVYTDKVPYQHKICEFRIPLSELGVSARRPSTLEFKYIAFGTGAGASGR